MQRHLLLFARRSPFTLRATRILTQQPRFYFYKTTHLYSQENEKDLEQDEVFETERKKKQRMEELQMRYHGGQIFDEKFINKSEEEIRDELLLHLEYIVPEVTKEDGYIPEDIPRFIIIDKKLKKKILAHCIARFGREIPNSDLNKFIRVQDIIDWYTNKALSERPKYGIEVPPNVRLFIEKNEPKRIREMQLKRHVEEMKERHRKKKRKEEFYQQVQTPRHAQQ